MDDADIYQSALINKPEHLAAIGLVSVEIAHLEEAMASLFSAISGVHWLVANAIYYTPNAAMARMDIISNVAPLTLHAHKRHLDKVNRFIERAKAAMGKRHQIMHSLWTLSEDRENLYRLKLPTFNGRTEVTLKDLHSTALQIQTLSTEISIFTGKLLKELPRDQPPLREYWKR